MSLYDVTVHDVEPVAAQWEDERPDPIFQGTVEMTDLEAYELRERLAVFCSEEFIGDYSVQMVAPRSTVFAVRAAVLDATTDEDTRSAAEELWDRYAVR